MPAVLRQKILPKGAAQHIGSVCTSYAAAFGLILGISKNLYSQLDVAEINQLHLAFVQFKYADRTTISKLVVI